MLPKFSVGGEVPPASITGKGMSGHYVRRVGQKGGGGAETPVR